MKQSTKERGETNRNVYSYCMNRTGVEIKMGSVIGLDEDNNIIMIDGLSVDEYKNYVGEQEKCPHNPKPDPNTPLAYITKP